MDQTLHAGFDGGYVSVGLPVRVDFEGPQRGAQSRFSVADWASEQICKGVRGICGHKETA